MNLLRIFYCVLFIGLSNYAQAQDIGVVWKKQYDQGLIENIKQIDNGTYIGCGRNWKDSDLAGVHRLDGLIVIFNEAGEQIARKVIRVPQSYLDTHTDLSTAMSSFRVAFKTKDGGYLIFGSLFNSMAPNSEKQPDWGNTGNSPNLINGTWIVKLDANFNIVRNDITRGVDIRDGWATSKGTYIIAGFDSNNPPDMNNTNWEGITMLRKYDQNGDVIIDKRASIRELITLYKYPNEDKFLAQTPVKVLYIDDTNETMDTSSVDIKAILNSNFPGEAMETHIYSVAPTKDGGMIIGAYLNFDPNPAIMESNGKIIFKLGSDRATVEFYKKEIPAVSTFFAPMLLSESTPPIYVGQVYSCDAVGVNCENKIYKLTDDGTFNYVLGEALPAGTSIRGISHTDGFFSCGTNSDNAVIAKLSTCVNFNATYDSLTYMPYSKVFEANKVVNYTGAKGTVTYSLEVKMWGLDETGTKILLRSLNHVTNSTPQLENSDGTGRVDIIYNYNIPEPKNRHVEVEHLLTLHDSYEIGGYPQSCDRTFQIRTVISSPTSTLFSDDIWFFGESSSGIPGTSKGIVFKKNKHTGKMEPEDKSNFSMVNTWENSLSISTPACNGDFIFYTQHNEIYNTAHKPMEKETGIVFRGHTSTGDGLAAAYIGGNKYVVFSVSDENNNGQLFYYIVDMSEGADNLGKVVKSGLVSSAKVAESIELLPKVGTYDEYWLVYYNAQKLKVIHVDGGKFADLNNPNPVEPVTSEAPCTLNFGGRSIYNMRSNFTFTKIIAVAGAGDFGVYNFCPERGLITFEQKVSSTLGLPYGACFSPSGEYLYITQWRDDCHVAQFRVSDMSLIDKKSFRNKGGGIKLGPDGKIYIAREVGARTMAVLSNPDSSFLSTYLTPTEILDENGFQLKSKGNTGLGISTGLTPPWLDPENTNKPPKAKSDAVVTYAGLVSNVLLPMENDSDPENEAIAVSGGEIEHINRDDTTKIKATYDVLTEKVKFEFADDYRTTKDTIFRFTYTIRDSGKPVQMCDEGYISVYVLGVSEIRIIDSCSFAPSLSVSLAYPDDYEIVWEKANKDSPAVDADWDLIAGQSKPKFMLEGLEPEKTYQYRYKIKEIITGATTYNSNPLKFKVETYKIGKKTWYMLNKVN